VKERLQMIGLSLGLVCFGALAWSLHTRSELHVDPAPLDALPRALDRWQGSDIPLDDTVEAMLRADHNLQRAYRHPLGDVIWLYVGYYGTQRGGRPEHTPWECYPSAGWEILERDRLDLDAASALRANEIVVERDGVRRLVYFWYQSHRQTGLLGGADQALDRLMGRIADGRADGALVRISTPLEPGRRDEARSRLAAFATMLDPEIRAHWPDERPTV